MKPHKTQITGDYGHIPMSYLIKFEFYQLNSIKLDG